MKSTGSIESVANLPSLWTIPLLLRLNLKRAVSMFQQSYVSRLFTVPVWNFYLISCVDGIFAIADMYGGVIRSIKGSGYRDFCLRYEQCNIIPLKILGSLSTFDHELQGVYKVLYFRLG